MSEANSPIPYDKYASLVQQARGELSPAECHGVLCALLAVQSQPTAEYWLNEVLPEAIASATGGDVLAREAVAQLVALYEQTRQQLASHSFGVELLLPEDDENLASRTAALSHWCRGFLYGLGLSGIGDISRLPDDLPEILFDMEKISHAEEYATQEDNEEDERAFAELVEYVRVGAMMLNEEFQNLHQQPGGNSQTH